MKTSSIGLVLSVCLLGGSSVRASIITFDQFANNGSGFFVSGVEAGYTITNGTVNNLAVNTTEPGTGDFSIGHQGAGSTIIQIDQGGGEFYFAGLDLKEKFSNSNPNVIVTGYTGSFGGTTIGTEEYGLTAGFVTHVATAGAGLLGDLITHLEINLGVGVGQTLVNNVQVVPEPSSLAFLALVATGGMTVRRRRKKT